MLCPRCHGQHWTLVAGQMLPCPECHGSGATHCCDGMAASPDWDAEVPSRQYSACGAWDKDDE